MADDSRRSGGVSGLELLSGRRIRIEKKMLKNLKEMEKRKTEILNKKSEAEKILLKICLLEIPICTPAILFFETTL